MLEIRNMNFSYDAKNEILKDLNMSFNEGNVVAIQGESGEGKSTLLTILSGLESRYNGDIVLDDKIINKGDLHKYNKENVGIVFQELNLINYLNLKDNILQGCQVKNKQVDLEKMHAYLEHFNLSDLDLNKFPSTLSGGQQQRIAIIRALLSDMKIILADEPTASIDRKNSYKIINQLKELAKKEDKIVIVITHDNGIAKECDEIYNLKNKVMLKSK